MRSLNKAMIIGHLGADPDVRYTQSNTAVANMSVATTERFKDSSGEQRERTEWHKVVAWNRLAEICRDYLKKGSKVYFEGTIQTNQWEDQNGQKRYTTEIKALNMLMLDSKGDNGGGSFNSGPAPQQQNAGKQSAPSGQSMGNDFDMNNMDDSDDDLPF